MICKNPECETATDNPQYCSRSCAAKTTNKLYVKRKLTNTCVAEGCATLVRSTTRYCGLHKGTWIKYKTLGDVRAVYNSNQASMLRTLGRTWAADNLDTSGCWYCGYSTHVDCCHVIGLKELPDEMLLVDTCVNNIIILCKNHHWEFDHQHLTLDEILKVSGGIRYKSH